MTIHDIRDDQQEALDAAVALFATEDRVQAIMACGTGKTFTAQRINERMTAGNPDSLTLVAVPNLVLVEQMIGEWNRHAMPGHEFATLAVNSKRPGKKTDQQEEFSDVDLTNVTSEPAEIAAFMAGPGRKTIFSTYQSMDHIATALAIVAKTRPGFQLDFIVSDEAHRTAGRNVTDTPSAFKRILSQEDVPAAKRLFMTATPKVSRFTKAERTEANSTSASMDDVTLYGPRAITRSLSWAVGKKLLADYRAYVVQISGEDLQVALAANHTLRFNGTSAEAQQIAAAIALVKTARQKNLGGIVTYSSTIEGAKEFKRILEGVVDALPADQKPSGSLTVSHINGGTPADERAQILATLDSTGRADGDWAVVTNCNVLTEGVNIPSMDGIMFVDPRKSIISIVQAIGRPMRLDSSNKNKIAAIILPVFIGEADNIQDAIEAGAFKHVNQTIMALRDVDDALSDKFVEHMVVRDSEVGGVGSVAEIAENPKEADSGGTTAVIAGGSAVAAANDVPGMPAGTTSEKKPIIGFVDHAGEPLSGQPEDSVVVVVASASASKSMAVDSETGAKSGDWTSWYKGIEVHLVDRMASSWERGIAALELFVKREGHARVSGAWIEGAFKLGSWVSVRRGDFKKGEISTCQKTRLEAFTGWTWDPFADDFERGINALMRFLAREGPARPPKAGIEGDLNPVKWVSKRRGDFKNGKLSTDQKARLEAIPGWTWDPFADDFERGISALTLFVTREGHARVATAWVEGDIKLHRWVSKRRGDFKNGKLSTDQKARLEAIPGWTWDPFADDFERGISALTVFVTREGHARVATSRVEGDIKLGSWVKNRRIDFKKGELRTDQEARLEAIPGWTWDPRADGFERGISALAAFVTREGHAKVPDAWVEDDFNLGAWVGKRRTSLKKGTLPASRIEALDAISITWRNGATAPGEISPEVRKDDDQGALAA